MADAREGAWLPPGRVSGVPSEKILVRSTGTRSGPSWEVLKDGIDRNETPGTAEPTDGDVDRASAEVGDDGRPIDRSGGSSHGVGSGGKVSYRATPPTSRGFEVGFHRILARQRLILGAASITLHDQKRNRRIPPFSFPDGSRRPDEPRAGGVEKHGHGPGESRFQHDRTECTCVRPDTDIGQASTQPCDSNRSKYSEQKNLAFVSST